MLQIRVTLITGKVGQKKDPGILECALIVNILSLSDEKPILSFETRTIIVFNLGKKPWIIWMTKKCTVSGQSGQGLIWRIGNWQTTRACVESTPARLITFLLSSLVDFSPLCIWRICNWQTGACWINSSRVDHFLEFLLSSFYCSSCCSRLLNSRLASWFKEKEQDLFLSKQ